MQIFNIKTDLEKDIPIDKERRIYRIKQLDNIKESLNNEKSRLDVFYADKRNIFNSLWSQCDPLRSEKSIIANICNTINVSNAWLKCYELLTEFKVFDEFKESFVHFDNAAFPGSFILATNHLAHVYGVKHDWYASSLVPSKENTALEDRYELYKRYRDKWIMGENLDGNVLSTKTQKAFYEKFKNTVDLYTSDIGTDVSNDYNNQELIQARLNVGQILSGLLTLKFGGILITKQYTVFEPITMNIMLIASMFFKEFYLVKPYSSRKANSESYLVGKGFNVENTHDILNNKYIKLLLDLIENWNDAPLFYHADCPKIFMKNVVNASVKLTTSQIEKIKADINVCEHTMNKQTDAMIKYKKTFEPDIIRWYISMQFKPVLKEDQLDMKDAYGQRL